MGFSRQEYGSGLPCPPFKPETSVSLALRVNSLYAETSRKPKELLLEKRLKGHEWTTYGLGNRNGYWCTEKCTTSEVVVEVEINETSLYRHSSLA